MSTINYLTVRNTILPVVNAVTANYSTLTGSTITATSMNLTSATISLGASTNQTYNNFSNGSYLTWATAKTGMTSANKTVQSANGLYQMIVANATSGLYLSSDSGITWSTLTGGLPTLTGSAYWSDGAISANGQYITLSIYGGSLWMSADYGRTFALTNQPTPSIWLPLNGSVADSMGSSTVTATGSPSYVTLNYPGYTAQAVNLLNTAGGTATRYIRGTWAGASNFTVSLWFNAQTINGTQQMIYSAYQNQLLLLITTSNQLQALIPSGGAGSGIIIGTTSFTLIANTWYYFTTTFQTGGTCLFYVNNTLIGSTTNIGGTGTLTSTQFSLGTFDAATANAFNGYIDDLRITNSVSTYVPIPLLQPNIWMPFENTAGDLGSHSLPPSATPTIYLPFEGNLTDSMGASAVTATGAVTYVAANREGYTGQAVNLANTAGSNATRYVRGTWTGAANFTVSFWMNPQTVNGTQQTVFSTYTGGIQVYIQPSSNFLFYQIPSGGASGVINGQVVTTYALSVNTWYYVTIIFQTNGLCSLYVNNTLIGSATNVGGYGTYVPTPFSLGTYDTATTNAFNGYIDDLRIYNSAIPYVPVSNVTVTGSLSYVPGVVGLNAVNLVNTAGGTPTNYINGQITPGNNVTISAWINFQSISTGFSSVIILGDTTLNLIMIYTNGSTLIFGYTNSSAANITIGSLAGISTNTWYHVYYVTTVGGSAIAYVNGQSVGSGTIASLQGTVSRFALSANTGGAVSAFNGYIDDLRIYNAAIPYHALFPQNYRALALSGTGQYALAAAASGWVVGSSDSSRTWSKQAVCVGTQSDLVQPQLTGLIGNTTTSTPVATTWIANGISWVSFASSVNSPNFQPWVAFNNIAALSGIVPYSWATPTVYNTSGTYTGSVTTTVLGGIGAVTGEWLQIQSSVPLIMTSYAYAVADYRHTPKTGYIVGSNDGMTWYPIQNISMITNPLTTNWTSFASYIVVNQNGTQTIQGGQAGSGTFTPYPTTTNAYTYFRVIGTSIWPNQYGNLEFTEWYINFARVPTQALSMNHTGQYQLVATGPAAGSIMPNRTGLAASTWSQGGVNWVSSVSTSLSGNFFSYNVFNNNITVDNTWAPSSITYGSSGNSSGITTVIQGVGTVTGDWVQLQSSVPLVMTSYQFASGGSVTQLPKTYYIVGSNDGSTWFPIQFGSGATSPSGNNTLIPGIIIVNSASAQTFGSSTITTTTYSTTTNAYTYFRLIGMTIYTTSGGVLEIGEWLINFSNSVSYSANYGATWLNTSPTVSNESVALSASGQYALSTNSVAPLARLTFDNTAVDSQGVLAPTTGLGTSFSYDTTKVVGSHSINFANTAGATSGITHLNYTVPTALNTPSALTISCWLYPTAFPVSPNAMTPIAFTNGATSGTVFLGPYLYFRTGSCGIAFNVNGGTTEYAETGFASLSLNTWTHVCATYNGSSMTLYVNGAAFITTNSAGRLTLSNGSSITNLFIGTLTYNLYAFRGNVDDVRIYTSALNADEVNSLYKNPALTQTVAVSSSYLPITGYSKPTLPGITANIVDTAVSQTGQYMVAVTSSTTNNVYYSTDYGATFTALTVGSSAMVSCSISYDGSYLTATNATTTYTLNRNTRGFSVTVGNQAGLINQAQNAIAIGDKAGQTNQSANSIVLNASGNALDAVAPGFYVAPVATAASSSAAPFNLLGYGTDNQIVQSSALTVLQNGNIVANGNVGIGTAPSQLLTIFGTGTPAMLIKSNSGGTSGNTASIYLSNAAYNMGTIQAIENANGYNGTWGSELTFATNYSNVMTERMRIKGNGNVGIGTTNPQYLLDAVGNIRVSSGGNSTGAGGIIYFNSAFAVNSNPLSGPMAAIGGFLVLGGANEMGCLTFSTRPSPTGSLTERIRITPEGNVGIGTNAPTYPFQVSTAAIDTRFNATNFYTGYTTNNAVVSNRLGWYSEYWDTNIYRGGNTDIVGWGVSFNGSSTTAPFLYISRLGNVGIGTTTPTSQLHVSGSGVNSTTTLTVSNTSNSNDGFGARLLFDNYSGNCTLGSIAALRSNNASDYRAYLAFSVNNENPLTLTERMRIAANGNVGIGYIAPAATLHVINPTLQAGNTTMVTAQIIGRPATSGVQNGTSCGFAIGAAGGLPDAASRMDVMVGGTPNSGNNWGYTPNIAVATFLGSGNVGIGTNAPEARLHVSGSSPRIICRSNDFDQTNGLLLQANDTNRHSYLTLQEIDASGLILRLGVSNNYLSETSREIRLETDGTARLIVYSSGVQTIHLGPQVDNAYDLGWGGFRWRTVWAANGVIQTSDSNVKDATPLSYGIHEILQMRTIKYKWKSQVDLPEDDPSKNFEYYGFCADELAPLFPELVYNEDTSAPVQMNYSELLPVVVNALKEEHASAVALKTTVDSQAEQIVSLQTKLDALLAWAQTQGFSGTF